MSTGDTVLLRVRIPKKLYWQVYHAGRAAGEKFPASIARRLADSLPLSTTAARSGCAGDGEADTASPELVT